MTPPGRRLTSGIALLLTMLALGGARAQSATADGYVRAGAPVILRAAPDIAGAGVIALAPGTPLLLRDATTDRAWLAVSTASGQSGWMPIAEVDVRVDLDARLGVWGVPDLGAAVSDHARAVWARGQARGRDPHMLAKVGDSITVSAMTLSALAYRQYHAWGRYDHLAETTAWFNQGRDAAGDSAFVRQPLAAGVGWSSVTLLTAGAGDPRRCAPAETPIDCEYRITNAALALILIGTNDANLLTIDRYRVNVARIVERTLGTDIVPILTTLPPRGDADSDRRVEAFNRVLGEVAAFYAVPLIGYHAALEALPDRGLSRDGVHPSEPRGIDDSIRFADREALGYGYTIRNLTTLQMLYALRRAVG